ncbi:MAG: helix-hairpin-helix domain-containing protein [bacterium]|nr:helix-hairpin-helix domain-containing protein [bacterium]
MRGASRVFAAAVLLAAFLAGRIHGQTDYEEKVMEGSEGDEASAAAAWERLDRWRDHPLDLNRAGSDELRLLPFFSPALAEAAVRERDLSGPFRDKRDFFERLGLDRTTADAVDPYVSAAPAGRGADRRTRHVRVSGRRGVPEPAGFRDGRYAGSPLAILAKAETRSRGGPSAGMVIEKDPGEEKWNDRLSGYAAFPLHAGRLRVTAGCFETEAGQGLVLWGPYASIPAGDPVGSVCRTAAGVSGSASSGENGRFSGCAAEWNGGPWSAILLGSASAVDASIDGSGTVTAFRTSGLHRTESEIAGRGACRLDEGAGRAAFRAGGFSAGGTFCLTRCSRTVNLEDEERRPYGFRGRNNAVWGLDWDWSGRRFRFCGEWARSRGGGAGCVASLAVQSDGASLCLSGRRMDADFHSFRAKGFGASSNEIGWTVGFKAALSKSTDVSGYADLARHPVRTWLSPLPSAGSVVVVHAERKLGSGTALRARIRFRSGQDSGDSAENAGDQDPGAFRSVRLDLDTRPRRLFRVRCRAEFTAAGAKGRSSSGRERGSALSEEIRWEPRPDWSVSAGLMLFDTDSWDTRVTVTESDWPGSFSMIPLYREGRRWSGRVRGAVCGGVSVTLKLAGIVYASAASRGSGPERVDGNSEWNAGAQVEWRIK